MLASKYIFILTDMPSTYSITASMQ